MVALVVKRVLMVAYHFPPVGASSGYQRTLRFAQYLPEHGWEPVVLTVGADAYESIREENLGEVPAGLRVERTKAVDMVRALSVGRFQFLSLGLPDRFVAWTLTAVPRALSLVRELKIDLVWTTFPIATAHLIGLWVNRLSGVPWVADFRDPMVQEGYPPYPLVHASYRRLERRTLARCAKATFTAPGAVAYYAQRYPALRSRLELLENGYDESAFAGASAAAKPDVSTKVTLLHSGSVYPYERDPRPFFAALAELKAERTASAGALRVVLRATGADDYLRPLVRDAGLEDIVELAPPVSYREALAEMLAADGLLLFQAGNCNYQVPAKLYEYLRARRPVLALTDAAGDSAAVLQRAGIDTIGQLDSMESIKAALVRFVGLVRSGRAPIASDASVSSASRAARTAQLAQIFEEAIRATEAAPDQAVAGSVRGSGKPGPLR